MKKITLLLVIIFTFLLLQSCVEKRPTYNTLQSVQSPTIGFDWTLVLENGGNKFYYDKDRVRKNGKYIYFWELLDYLKPSQYGDLSLTTYTELDCSIFRYKVLKVKYYKNSRGEGEITTEGTPPDEWKYPPPNTSIEFMYNKICEEHQ